MENVRELKVTTFNDVKDNVKVEIKTKKKIKVNKVKFMRFWFYLNLIFIFALVTITTVDNTKMVNISSDNLIAKNMIGELELELTNLENTIKPYLDEQRIEKIAKERLDMIYPNDSNLVELKSETGTKVLKLEKFSTVKESENNSITSMFSIITNIFR